MYLYDKVFVGFMSLLNYVNSHISNWVL